MSKQIEELDRLERIWREAVCDATIVQDALARAEVSEKKARMEYQDYMRKLNVELDRTNKSGVGNDGK